MFSPYLCFLNNIYVYNQETRTCACRNIFRIFLTHTKKKCIKEHIFFEKGHAQPLHRTDAYGSLLTYLVAVSSIITSLCVVQGEHIVSTIRKVNYYIYVDTSKKQFSYATASRTG
jgi:hypothetical protein